jgi:hypothetical protein
MELLIGGGCLVGIYAMLCMLGHGYANTVDRIALSMHRHAQRVQRMHASREAQLRGWWRVERRRMGTVPETKPVSIQQGRRAS